MIPTHWFRRIILILFIMEVGGGIFWVAGRIFPDPSYNPAAHMAAQIAASLVFLFGFYAAGPLSARFLAPVASSDPARQRRLAAVVGSLTDSSPVFLYDHPANEANTVGLVPAHSRIYLTTGLLDNLSDQGLNGVIAHENAHVRERHILVTLVFACCFVIGSHTVLSRYFFLAAFLLFLLLRRYCEYRADAGGAAILGRDTMLVALQELAALYPTKPWQRALSFLSAYPTLPMRMRALETGRKALV